jgi:hypothetical protein
MADIEIKPIATIEKILFLSFTLPGVNWETCSRGNNSGPQFEPSGERWKLNVSAGNVRETAERLQAVVDELLRFAEAEHL